MAKKGSKQAMHNQLSVFLQLTTSVWSSLQADKEGVTLKKLISVSMYYSMARLGNLGALNVEDVNITSTSNPVMLDHNRAFVVV